MKVEFLKLIDKFNETTDREKKIRISKIFYNHMSVYYRQFLKSEKEQRIPSVLKKKKFVKSFTPTYRGLISTIMDDIMVFTFKQIYNHHKNCLSLLPKNKKYAIYIVNKDYIKEKKSVPFFGLFMLRYAMVNLGLKTDYLFYWDGKKPDIDLEYIYSQGFQDLIYFDDISYSGKQLSTQSHLIADTFPGHTYYFVYGMTPKSIHEFDKMHYPALYPQQALEEGDESLPPNFNDLKKEKKKKAKPLGQ
jgi:hypothetical protein